MRNKDTLKAAQAQISLLQQHIWHLQSELYLRDCKISALKAQIEIRDYINREKNYEQRNAKKENY